MTSFANLERLACRPLEIAYFDELEHVYDSVTPKAYQRYFVLQNLKRVFYRPEDSFFTECVEHTRDEVSDLHRYSYLFELLAFYGVYSEPLLN